jgi:iron(III) transport system substrate-binding protein
MGSKLSKSRTILAIAGFAAIASTLVGCSSDSSEGQSLVVYSGRSEEFIAPFFSEFTEQTGIQVDVRYGDSAALAAQILEEGENSPADLFLAQDAGSLGAVSAAGLLRPLEQSILGKVETKYQSVNQDWIGITGRARVFVYSPERVDALPKSIEDLLDSQWKGRLAIAPTNASFQAFITALIQSRGDAATEQWLTGLMKNEPKFYEKNAQIVEAVDAGEIDLGLVNHYYLWEVAQELGRELKAAIDFFQPGDLGNLVNVSGAGIFNTAKNSEGAQKLLEYLLSEKTQAKFVSETHEYSIVNPTLTPADLPALSAIKSPAVDLSTLADLKRTQDLLIRVGLL